MEHVPWVCQLSGIYEFIGAGMDDGSEIRLMECEKASLNVQSLDMAFFSNLNSWSKWLSISSAAHKSPRCQS